MDNNIKAFICNISYEFQIDIHAQFMDFIAMRFKNFELQNKWYQAYITIRNNIQKNHINEQNNYFKPNLIEKSNRSRLPVYLHSKIAHLLMKTGKNNCKEDPFIFLFETKRQVFLYYWKSILEVSKKS